MDSLAFRGWNQPCIQSTEKMNGFEAEKDFIMKPIEHHYDATTETKVLGEIASHQDLSCGVDGLIRIPLNAAKLEVFLGPAWFMKTQDLTLLKEWPFEVTGSLLQRAGTDILLAREILCNDHRIFLRDPFGQPLWKMWCRRVREIT